jgi:gliding motility-associated lipoprotein GldH
MKTAKASSKFKSLIGPLWIGLCAAFFLTNCRSDIVYSQFSPISYSDGAMSSSDKWHMDSVVRFDYTIEDAQPDYQLLVYVRHTERYPYQNMWLFVEDSLRKDTIEFYLADDRGQWLGNKHHGFIEMPVLLESNYHYPDTGHYSLSIRHGMRDSLLRGITDVGIEIIRNGKE